MTEVKDQNNFIKEEIICNEALLERVSNSTRDSFIDFSFRGLSNATSLCVLTQVGSQRCL